MEDGGEVALRIRDAAEAILLDTDPASITIRQIAQRAGTTPAMVGYYYEGKDGVFKEIIHFRCSQIRTRIDEVNRGIRDGSVTDPIRAIIAVTTQSFRDNEALARLAYHGLSTPGSPIGAYYRDCWPDPVQAILEEALCVLREDGLVREGLDQEGLVQMLRAVIFMPLMAPHMLPPAFDLGERWSSLIGDVFRAYLLPERG